MPELNMDALPEGDLVQGSLRITSWQQSDQVADILARRRLEKMQKGLSEKAWVFCLQGPMGVGKTHFVGRFVKALGGPLVSSPTYAFHHVYSTPVGRVDHWDLMRVKDLEELESLGFWEQLRSADMSLIEWPDAFPGIQGFKLIFETN